MKNSFTVISMFLLISLLLITASSLVARSQCPPSNAGCWALEQSCFDEEFLSYWAKSSYCSCWHMCTTIYEVYCWDYDVGKSYKRYGSCEHFVYNYCKWIGGF